MIIIFLVSAVSHGVILFQKPNFYSDYWQEIFFKCCIKIIKNYCAHFVKLFKNNYINNNYLIKTTYILAFFPLFPSSDLLMNLKSLSHW